MPSLTSVASSVVSEVGLDSQLGSASGNPFAPTQAQPSPPGFFAKVGDFVLREVVKPSVWVRTPAGTARWSPYGAPQTNLVPVVGAVALVGAAAATAGLVGFGMWLAKRAARKQNPPRRRRRR